jgi:hypothetical protein
MSKTYRVWCNQCDALVINGIPCHETGCRNAKQRWVYHFGYCYPEDVELPESFKEKEAK